MILASMYVHCDSPDWLMCRLCVEVDEFGGRWVTERLDNGARVAGGWQKVPARPGDFFVCDECGDGVEA